MTNTMILLVLIAGVVGVVLALIGSRFKTGMSVISMYNISACLIIASIISAVISFVAVCNALPGDYSKPVTQQEVIVDIFSVLVTILMGWNIISVVDIKRNAEKVNAVSKDLEVVISSMIELDFHSFNLREDKRAVIHHCFNMLSDVQDCENQPIRKTAEEEIIKLLELIKASYETGENVIIYKGEREQYLDILKQIKGVWTGDVKYMIYSADERGLREEGDNLSFNNNPPENFEFYDASNMENKR